MKVAKKYSYEVVVMLVSVATASFVLHNFALVIKHLLKIQYNAVFECCMILGMLLFQFIFIYKKKWQLQINYYFQLLLVSLFGSIMLIPLLVINHCCPTKIGNKLSVVHTG